MTTVRVAQIEDAEAIARVRVAAWKVAYRGIIADDVLDAMDDSPKPRLLRQLAGPRPGQSILVCASEGVVRGFVNCGPYRIDQDPSRTDPQLGGEIYAIYVDPDAWRDGYGSALMTAAERSLARASFIQCRLWTLAENHGARRFYERRGYARDGGQLDYTAADGTQVPEVRYRKLLDHRLNNEG